MPDPSGGDGCFCPRHFRIFTFSYYSIAPLFLFSSQSSLLCPRRSRAKIFARTLHQFNRSPQALQRRSFTSTPPSSPSLNGSKPNSPLGASRKVSADFDNLRMAFSLGASTSGGSAPAELGPELSDVYTDVRQHLRAFTAPWMSSN